VSVAGGRVSAFRRVVAGNLRSYLKVFLALSPWVSLGLSIVFLYVATYGLLVGGAYITDGRVTYYASFYRGYEGMFLLAAALLALYSATASSGLGRRSAIAAVAYTALTASTYLLNPILLCIPYTALLVVLTVNTYRGRAWGNLVRGLALSAALLELPALAFRVGVFLGLRAGFLEPANAFTFYLNSSLWATTILVSAAVAVAPLASVKLGKAPESGPGGGGGDVAYVALALSVALAVGLAGHSPAVNPRGVPVDVDWIHYYRWLNTMMGSADPVAAAFQLAGDRPAFLLALYAVAKLFRADLLKLCVYMEVALIQFYTLASYYVAREYLGNRAARYAALLAPLTPHALSFIYGGFQADLFSLTLIYVALGLSARPSLRRLPAVAALSVLASLTHAWTWFQFTALVSAYVLVSAAACAARRRLRELPSLTPYTAYVAPSSVAYLALRTYIYTEGLTNFEMNLKLFWAAITSRAPDLGALWRNSLFYFNIYTGGTLTNYIYWLLVLVGSAVTQLSTLIYIVASLPLTSALAMYAYTEHSSLLAYRTTINTPTHLLVAKLFDRLPRDVRVCLYITLLSLALGKVLSIVPKF